MSFFFNISLLMFRYIDLVERKYSFGVTMQGKRKLFVIDHKDLVEASNFSF